MKMINMKGKGMTLVGGKATGKEAETQPKPLSTMHSPCRLLRGSVRHDILFSCEGTAVGWGTPCVAEMIP